MSNENIEAMEQTAEILETEGAIEAPKKAKKRRAKKAQAEAPKETRDTVFVFANLPSGQLFNLPNGKKVRIGGMPVSSLVKPSGEFFRGGKYGITEIPAGDWEAIAKLYGSLSVIKNGLIFAANSIEEGKAMARERDGLRHGYEPIDPTSRKKTRPQEV